jgi:hypothetical protein
MWKLDSASDQIKREKENYLLGPLVEQTSDLGLT